jgi:hypothetical protein
MFKQKKTMIKKLKYQICGTYPKEKPCRYDDGPLLKINDENLF